MFNVAALMLDAHCVFSSSRLKLCEQFLSREDWAGKRRALSLGLSSGSTCFHSVTQASWVLSTRADMKTGTSL